MHPSLWLTKPENVGPVGRHEKLRFIGVMISRQPFKTSDLDEGTYFVGQGHYMLEVLERVSTSMHCKTRNTPGEPESFSKDKKQK
eukprot:12914575-Prorocentrum_lima.AAC.1